MRKLYSFFAFAIMMLVSLVANAWSFDLPSENTVLQSEEYNYRLFKSFNFFGAQFNDQPMTDGAGNTVSGDGCFTLSADKASFKLNGFDTYQVLSPVEMEGFYIQIGTGALNLRGGVNKDGLHNYGSGSRFFALADIKAGQIIVMQGGVTSSRESVIQPSAAITDATPCEYEDITDEIHAAQAAVKTTDEEGNEVDGTPDAFKYWRATTDGFFVVELQRDCAMQGLQIWIDASASEAVSSPTLKLTGVDGETRNIELKPGESTFGNECTTWYGIADAGEEALYLIDTEEIDHYDYTFETDEEGNQIKTDSVAVYKKIIDPKYSEQGIYGDNPFDPEVGLSISNNDDEDGDGYVTILAATVSSSGVFSDVVSLNVSVGEVILNAPTLTLEGVSGTDRVYSLGWSNNTLCGESYQFIVEGDDGYSETLEANTGIGSTFTFNDNVKVTVKVPGYGDGVYELAEVDFKGIDIQRKNQDNAAEEKHDWDFVNLSQEQKNIIMGTVAKTCFVVNVTEERNDTVYYTVDEYNAGISNDGVDLTGAELVYEESCWGWDASKKRATLNVVSDTIVTDVIINNKNANGYGYVEDKAKIFGEGLTVDCAPNANNASCIFSYINDDLGVYLMSKSTLTFDRSIVSAGELVVMYYGQGGSTWTDWRKPLVTVVPADGPCVVNLPTGSHVFYIDIYTYNNLPEDDYATGVETNNANVEQIASYNMSGVKVSSLQKGINIVKYSDGSVKKIYVK